MTPPGRWPLHPAPGDGESLSSWLALIAAGYRMTVGQLLEHGLGHDREVEWGLDRDLPATLLAALELRTGVSVERAMQMCVAGWIPWLLDSVQAHPENFDTYVRQFSVLLGSGTRSRHRAERWTAWVSVDRVQRACPQCLQDPGRAGLRLIWQLPLTLSCPEHGVILQACACDPGGVFVWMGEPEPRGASLPVLRMDRRTEQALSVGRVELPGRAVHAGVWFRVLRTIIDEVSTAAGYWRPHDVELRSIWESAGHPVRAGIPAWRPYEKLSWPVQAQLLDAAAHAIGLLEDGAVRGRGAHAELFFPIYEPVDDGCPPTATCKADAPSSDAITRTPTAGVGIR